jgi:transposase-like protein
MPKSSKSTARSRSARWTASEASAVLDALGSSGLSVAAFARQEGVCPQRIYSWRRQLSRRAAAAQPLRSDFIEVITSAPRRSGVVEIALPISGLVLRVDESVDVAALRRIVDALSGAAQC